MLMSHSSLQFIKILVISHNKYQILESQSAAKKIKKALYETVRE
jgi:hypothetical protein